VAGTIIPIAAAKAIAASVTTAITAPTPTIAAAVAAGCGSRSAGLSLVETVGRSFAAFGELFVEDVLFGVGLVEIFLMVFVFGFGFVEIVEAIVDGIVNAVFFFEVLFLFFFIDVAGAGDLIDGHLADHGAEIGGSFERLFLFEVVHLLNGAGVKSGVVVLLVEGLLYQSPGAGYEGGGRSFGGDVASGVEGSDIVRSGLGDVR
jgi:hypothetical protein